MHTHEIASIYTLFSARRTAGMAPHMILEEIGVPYRLEMISLDEPRSAEYLAINPTGKVPALRVEGTGTLFESAAISMFLADRHPEANLAPDPAEHQRALYYQWMFYLASTVEPLYFLYHYPERHTINLEHGDELRERAIQRFPEVWRVVDDALAKRGPYLLGDRFTACDIFAFMLARWSGPADDLCQQFSSLATCVHLVDSRPAIERAMRHHQPVTAAPGDETGQGSATHGASSAAVRESSEELALPEAVLDFWFRDQHRPLWFNGPAWFDDEIRRRFEPTVQAALEGRLVHWRRAATSAMALIVVLDQFPRNLYRGTPRAYAGDAMAVVAAEMAVSSGFDRDLPGAMRMFLYMPFHHSEDLAHQDRSVALYQQLRDEARDIAPDELQEQLEYASRYRETIRRFGRFPHRNDTLGRHSTAEELQFLHRAG
jgi:glutathione S-transferase